MSLYATGTITGALNATIITGTGTKWIDAKIGITNGSVLFVSSNAGVDGVYQVKRVISDTSIELAQPIYKTFTNSKYAILVAESASTAAWANQLAATLGYYQAQMDGWQQIMTGTGDIALTAPDGTKVTIKSFTKLSNDLDKKANSTDLTDSFEKLSSDLDKKANTDSLGWWATANPSKMENVNATLTSAKNPFAGIGFYNSPTAGVPTTYGTALQTYLAGGGGMSFFQEAVSSVISDVRLFARNVVVDNAGNATFGKPVTIRHSGNTTVASDGTLKAASPIVNIFHDGTFDTNDESEGAQVSREDVGVYRISNVLGMNSDRAWGGNDGGFEIPKDRNGQRLIWLDYEVEADGSILVKTYHRTYPDAPIFARNIKDGYEESDPIDIPSDQFLSVRVEMPQDSIWNQAQRAAQEEMEQEKTTEE